MEQAEEYRHMPKYKKIYERRKETIERVFAVAKQKHGMRYTQYRGSEKVRIQAVLTFACMNLKKLAKMKRDKGLLQPTIFAAMAYMSKLLKGYSSFNSRVSFLSSVCKLMRNNVHKLFIFYGNQSYLLDLRL